MRVGEDVETSECPYTAGGQWNGAITLETVWEFFKILNLELSYDPVISLLGIYPR